MGDDRVEASIEVGIQFIIARSELDSVAFDPIAHLEDRVAHTDVQRLRLFTARDRAAIVVGQDDDGHIAQGRIEQSLRADVEIGYVDDRSEEHTSELQSLMRISYAVFCLKKNTNRHTENKQYTHMK